MARHGRALELDTRQAHERWFRPRPRRDPQSRGARPTGRSPIRRSGRHTRWVTRRREPRDRCRSRAREARLRVRRRTRGRSGIFRNRTRERRALSPSRARGLNSEPRTRAPARHATSRPTGHARHAPSKTRARHARSLRTVHAQRGPFPRRAHRRPPTHGRLRRPSARRAQPRPGAGLESRGAAPETSATPRAGGDDYSSCAVQAAGGADR